jgi:hypothetical protein
MRIAVGECQAADPLWIQCGEDLRDAAAAIVSHEVNPINSQSVKDFSKHLCIGCNRHVLTDIDFSVAMGHQVNGDAAPNV